MEYKVYITKPFDPGTVLTVGNNVFGIVTESENQKSEVLLVDRVLGMIKYKNKKIDTREASEEQFQELLQNKPDYVRLLSLEEKIYHTVNVYMKYGKETAIAVIRNTLRWMVTENAAHEEIQEYASNVDFILSE